MHCSTSPSPNLPRGAEIEGVYFHPPSGSESPTPLSLQSFFSPFSPFSLGAEMEKRNNSTQASSYFNRKRLYTYWTTSPLSILLSTVARKKKNGESLIFSLLFIYASTDAQRSYFGTISWLIGWLYWEEMIKLTCSRLNFFFLSAYPVG